MYVLQYRMISLSVGYFYHNDSIFTKAKLISNDHGNRWQSQIIGLALIKLDE